MRSEQQAMNTGYLSMAGNACMAVIKAITGVAGNSHALIADAIESTADVFSSGLVVLGIKYSTKPADKNHPYGHGRAEPLITFLVVVFLVISALIIAVQSIHNIRTPHALPAPFTLIVLGCIIGIKEFFYRRVLKRSRHLNSSSLRAEAWHHRSDAITSVCAFVGISVALLFGKGYESADDWAALAACLVIAYNAYRLFRPALGEIMDEDVHGELVESIRKLALDVKGVIATEKCLIRKTGMKYHVDLHVVVNASITVREGHSIAHSLKSHLQQELPQLADILVHVEPDK